MAKEKELELEGIIHEALPGGKFRVKLENGIVVMAYLSGKMRQNIIHVIPGDQVVVAMSAYDPTQGRIIWRD